MAITYHAGRRIQKLDNDTIPTASTCDTFTSDNWTDVGGLFGVSGKQFHFQVSTSARDDHASLDTGSLLSASTTWTLRFNKIRFTTITNNDPNLIVGLSDTTVGGKQNQKFIGARILPQGGSASGLFRPYSVNGTPPRAGQDASHTLQYSADTDYYVEIKKTASNAYRARLSTTPEHTGDLVDDSQGGINSSITGRYIKVMNGEDETGGTLIGTIESIEFWTPAPSDSDHKTENQMPLNNQVGSRLEETNTRKMFNYSDTSKSKLKAYYHFEDNGTNAQTTGDGFGSSADMTLTGATYETGKVGSKAISFDGTNDHAVIGLPSASSFNFLADTTHEWTVAFWIKNDDFSSLGMILSTAVELGSSRYGLGIRAQSSGSIYVHFCNGTNQNRFTTTQTGFSTDGNWHFIVITAKKSDSTNSLEFWQDGTSLGTASNSGKDFVDTNASQAPYIGQAGDSSQYLDGALDELSIWNRRLSDSEISTLYNSGTGLVIADGMSKSWEQIGT